MGGGSFPKIPDYKIYKVEDAPQLVKLQEKLAKHGLKDPWIRNEVWRYTIRPKSKGTSAFGSMGISLLRGFPLALGATVCLVFAEKTYHTIFPDQHHDDAH